MSLFLLLQSLRYFCTADRMAASGNEIGGCEELAEGLSLSGTEKYFESR